MNADRLINMFARKFLRKTMNKSIDKLGGDSPEEKKRVRQTKQMASQMRKTQRLLRRMGRF